MAKQQKTFMKHIMTGISYMIPIVVAGGILGALAKAFGGWNIGSAIEAGATPFSNLNPFTWVGFWWGVNKLSSYAMDFAVAVMTAGAAYSIAGRPGIVPGMVIGYCSAQSKAGFLGGLLMAFIIGAVVNWMKGWKLPKWCEGLKPVMIIPVCSTFLCGMIFLCVFSIPLAWIMDVFQQWIISLNGGAKAVIGGVIGACMGFDMGGPVNKTASMAANALGADGINGPMCAKIIGGMTPPIGLFIATMLKKRSLQRQSGRRLRLLFLWDFASSQRACFLLRRQTRQDLSHAVCWAPQWQAPSRWARDASLWQDMAASLLCL